MGILDKLKESSIERKKDQAILKSQKAEARSEYLEEKRLMELEFAREKARIEKEEKVKRFREQFKQKQRIPMSARNVMGGLQGASRGILDFATTGFGGMPGFQPPRTPVTKPTIHRVKKGKKGKKYRATRPKPQQPQMQGYNWF